MRKLVIHEDNVTYEEWCKANGFDPSDDENYSSYCEWKSNS